MNQPTQSLATQLDQSLPVEGRDADAFQPGQRLGHFALRRKLGAGGMGVVFLADQLEPVQRPVALKLMRRQIAGGLAEAYFTIECQALAQMDHPAIARVYEAGRTHDGYPFLAMEWVDGDTLDSFLEQHPLARPQRLRLLAQLVRAAHHAHLRRVVHRDLKPSNVLVSLVDGQPQPKIIDFGIAIGVDARTQASMGSSDPIGTRVFMSPEQRRALAIDPRTDVYALGMIVLCSLLSDSAAAVCNALAGDHEAALARLRRGLKDPRSAPSEWRLGELGEECAAVVARCLADLPARYESALALAQDLDHLAADEPVSALPASRWYSLRKLLRRQRLAFALGGLAALALIGGFGSALYGFWQADQQRQVAQVQAERAQREARRSEQVAGLFESVLSGIDPERALDLDKALMRLVLDDAATRAESELKGDPETLARIQFTISSAFDSIGEREQAYAFANKAHAQAAQTYGEAHDEVLRYLIQRASIGLEILEPEAALAEAERVWQRAQALQQDDRRRYDAATVLAVAQSNEGNAKAALATLTPLLEPMRQHLAPVDPVRLEFLLRYAVAASDLGQFEPARAAYQERIDALESIAGPNDPRLIPSLNGMGVLMLQQERYADGEPYFRRCLVLCELIYGKDHVCALTATANLAGSLRQQGKLTESGPYYQRAFDMTRERYGENHPRAIITRTNLGNYWLDMGEAAKALALQKQALASAQIAWKDGHPVMAEIYTGLGKAATATGDFQAAEAWLLDAQAQKAKLFPAGHRRIRQGVEALIALYRAWGRAAEVQRWEAELAAVQAAAK